MKFRIWKNSIEDARLQNILTSFGGDVTEDKEYSEDSQYTGDVIFGSWKERDAPHHNLKRGVVKNSNNLIVIETPLLGRAKVESVMPDDWFRVGLNGFLRNADYPKADDTRFREILAKTGAGENFTTDTHHDGDYILVVLQLPGDASLEFKNINEWAKEVVTEIREITDRDIVIRLPQLPREYDLGFTQDFKSIYFQSGKHEDKEVTLKNAYAVITYSSGMGVESVLSSRRTYFGSDNSFYTRRSSIKEVLRPDYQNFEDLDELDNWLDLVASTQWHKDEIADGSCRRAFEELISGK